MGCRAIHAAAGGVIAQTIVTLVPGNVETAKPTPEQLGAVSALEAVLSRDELRKFLRTTARMTPVETCEYAAGELQRRTAATSTTIVKLPVRDRSKVPPRSVAIAPSPKPLAAGAPSEIGPVPDRREPEEPNRAEVYTSAEKEPSVSPRTPVLSELRIADADTLAQVMHHSTEDNVALLFQKEFGHRFRYCKAWGWLAWDGARWRVERTDAAFDFCRAVARQVNKQGKSSIAKSSFARGVESYARAARCFVTVPEDWDQDDFAFNTPEGVVDLRTGTMRPHSGKEYLTKVTRIAPRGSPKPTFDRFMRQITLDDTALIAYHQRSLGATLSGARADHWLLFWIGAGRNGKNTLGELVEWILGDYAKTISTETLMSAQTERHPTELANLRALRLAISSEVPEGAHWNESRIKSLTGDASISARYMRGDFFEFPRGHKHLVYGNHRPLLRVVDDAMRARMHVVPFKATFSEELGNRDPLLPEKLRAEAPAILAWLIDGHLQWVEAGYTLRKCEAVKRETDDYLSSQSTPDMWISERCELMPDDDRPTGSLEKASVLYRDYSDWKEARGEHAMGQVRWGEWMSSRFGKVKSDGVRYRGIRLKFNDQETPYWQR